MRARSVARWLACTAAAVCVLMVAAAPVGVTSSDALAASPEWNHLARLWQALSDHSSNQICNQDLFQALTPDINAVNAELAALTDRGALRKPVSDYLGRLFHMRYEYLADYQYTTRSSMRESPFEASRQAALWVVELQLALLRKPELSKSDAELARAAESNLAYQLTYLSHVEKFNLETDERRIEMKKREDAGEKVDWKAFDQEVERRQDRLLTVYRSRKLPRVPVVHEAGPYIVSLTRLELSSAGAAAPGP